MIHIPVIPHSFKLNQVANYLGQKSCFTKIIVQPDRHTHTHWTRCSTWASKIVDNNTQCLMRALLKCFSDVLITASFITLITCILRGLGYYSSKAIFRI